MHQTVNVSRGKRKCALVARNGVNQPPLRLEHNTETEMAFGSIGPGCREFPHPRLGAS